MHSLIIHVPNDTYLTNFRLNNTNFLLISDKYNLKYQSSGAGVTLSLPATPHRLQNPKWLLGGPKVADGVWKGVHSQVFWHSHQLLQNKFFDLSTPSTREGRNRENGRNKMEWKIMTCLVATNAVAS